MRRLIILCVCLFSTCVFGFSDQYQFESTEQQAQFQQLTNELRCLVCQNQNLAESDAPLAKDLRDKVYAMVRAGQSSKSIKDYLVKRYGDFVLYKPPLEMKTYVLWFGPLAFLVIALAMLFYNVLRCQRKTLQEEKREGN